MSFIFFWQFRLFLFLLFRELGGFGLLGSCWEGYVCYMYNAVRGLAGNIPLSRDEADFTRILGTKNDRELFRGYPSPGPVDVWLYCREPGISQDDVSISYVR